MSDPHLEMTNPPVTVEAIFHSVHRAPSCRHPYLHVGQGQRLLQPLLQVVVDGRQLPLLLVQLLHGGLQQRGGPVLWWGQ